MKIKSFLKNNKEKIKGFTLLETLVAIFIFVVAVIGPLAFSQHNLRVAFMARDQVTAFFLAQDVIEQIKNHRDGRMIKRNSLTGYSYKRIEWLDELNNCISPNICTINTDIVNNSPGSGYFSSRIKQCGSGSHSGCYYESTPSNSKPLYYNKSTNTYSTEQTLNTEESIFYRTIEIEPITPDPLVPAEEAKVTVNIYWQSHPNLPARSIEVVEYITNWIPRPEN